MYRNVRRFVPPSLLTDRLRVAYSIEDPRKMLGAHLSEHASKVISVFYYLE